MQLANPLMVWPDSGHTCPTPNRSSSFSGAAWPSATQCNRWLLPKPSPSQDLIRSQRHNAKHQVRHNLGCAANPHLGGSVLIFQPAEDPFYRGALPIATLFVRSQLLPLRSPLLIGNDRHMTRFACVLANRRAVETGVHHFVTTLDSLRAHLGERDCSLHVV